MKSQQNAALARYVSRGRKSIDGWFARTDAEIFRAVLLGQSACNLAGSAVEIGAHHGRSLVAICLGLSGAEKAYCIDIFEQQQLNRDRSGRGDRAILESNLARFGVDAGRVVIDPRSSQTVKPDDVLNQVGPARLFSIDGGHWQEIVESDLRLAEATIAAHGVIALDDFLRVGWPNVTAGYFAWYGSRRKPLVPFAMGFNKLYLCHEGHVAFYQELLASDPFLRFFVTQRVDYLGHDVLVYKEYISPDMGLRAWFLICFRYAMPNFYARLRRWLKRPPPGVLPTEPNRSPSHGRAA
ncbi:MAG TPA: class I SAM-dependent methyltransferase [Stellaceae bacterium]|nr:class I SAM-dependent methyltransferase [Stellaceae bacterium]